MTRAGSGIYRGISADQRRDERRRRLMDAALDSIGTQGWAATSVRGICEQARVGPRFFYESFEDLNALAGAVHDEIVDALIRTALDAIDHAPDEVPAKLRAAIAAAIVYVTDDRRRARVGFAEAHGSETLMRRRFAAMRTLADVVAREADSLLDLPPGSEAMVQAYSLLVIGGVAEMVLVWLDGGLDVDRDGLIELSAEFLITTAESLPGIAGRLSNAGAVEPNERRIP